MANIDDKVTQIRQATYGKEVRESIANGIEAINTEVIKTTARQDQVDTQELTRQTAEQNRQKQEGIRQTTFDTSEASRKTTFEASEASRKTTFTTNETARQTTFGNGETDRQSAFNTNEGKRKTTFDASEATRQTNENDRKTNETTRQTNETIRIKNEDTRKVSFKSMEDRFGQMEVSNATLEVVAARNGEVNLSTRLNKMTTATDNLTQDVNEQLHAEKLLTFYGENTVSKIDSNRNSLAEKVIIEGKTIQNFIDDATVPIPFTATVPNITYVYFYTFNKTLARKKYTVILNYTITNSSGYACQVKYKDNTNKEAYLTFNNITGSGTNVYNSVKIVFDNTTNNGILGIGIASVTGGGSYSGSITSLMIIEGDWTNKELPPHFTGIKSVGEDDITDGKYPVVINSYNTLFNSGKAVYRDLNKLKYSLSGDIVTATLLNDGDCWVGYDISQNHSILKPNTTYTFSFDIIDMPDTVAGLTLGDNTQITLKEPLKKGTNIGKFNTTNKTNLAFGMMIQVRTTTKGTQFKFSKSVMLLEGDLLAGTLPICKSDDATIILSEPLRGLPNGVKDTVDFEKNIITRNIGYSRLISDTNMYIAETNDKTIRFNIEVGVKGLYIAALNVISDIFVSYTQTELGGVDSEGISSHEISGIQIRILKSRLQTPNVAGFKTWLNTNIVKIQFQTAPRIEPIAPQILEIFKDGLIVLNNKITPTIKFSYPVNVTSVVNGVIDTVNTVSDDVGNIKAIVAQLGNPNLLINGDFQVWQNGESFTNSSGAQNAVYAADKWQTSLPPNSTVIKNSIGNMEIKFAAASNFIGQIIDNRLPIGTYIMSMKAKINGSFKMTYEISSGVFVTKQFNGNNIFQIYTCVIDINSDDSRLKVFPLNDVDAGTCEVSWVKLEYGLKATPFTPKPYIEELQDCLMYINGDINIPYSKPNLLANGDFQVWQRGISFSNLEVNKYIYTADKWRILSLKAGVGVSKTTNGISISSPSGAGVTVLSHAYEVPSYLLGKTVTVSFDIKSSVNYESVFYVFNGNNNTSIIYSKNTTVNTEKQRFKFTFTLPLTIADNILNLWFGRSSDIAVTVEIANVKLELGAVATPLVPRLYTEELSLCQRYYQVYDYRTDSGGKIAIQYLGQLNRVYFVVDLTVPMRILPTVTANPYSGIRFLSSTGAINITDAKVINASSIPRSDTNNVLLVFMLPSSTSAASSGWIDGFILNLDSGIY